MRPLLLATGILVVFLAAVTVIALLHALRLDRQVSSLPATIGAVEIAAENGQMGSAQLALQRAQSTLTSVNSSLYNSPEFEILHLLPMGRQNLDAVRRAVTLGLQMVAGGEQILRAASPLESPDGHLDVPLNAGHIPLATTEAVATAITEVVTGLPTSSDPLSGAFVIGRVRTLERRVYDEAVKRRNELESVDSGLSLVDDIAGANGARRFLIAVANTAEMRGSGGMILSYGVLTSNAGTVTLAHFGDIDELKLTKPETKVAFPPDFATTYADLAPTLNWRNVNMMSDFTVDAPVMEAMYTQATGLPVDGVMQVDPAGLGAILAGVGAVQTPDLGQVTAANVVPLTLSEAYQRIPARQLRQEYTGEVAQAALAGLLSGHFAGLRPLGGALLKASRGRHILMYATDPIDESIVRALGFDGALPPSTVDFAQLTVQNFGGNKLDYYLQSGLSLTGTRPSPVGSHMVARIDLSNTTPPGQTSPVEVFGPFNPGGEPGEYQGLVTLYLPVGAYLEGSQTDSTISTDPVQASQNGVATVTFTVAIPPGADSQVVLDLYIPPTPSRSGAFEFVPVPRVIPTRYNQKFT